MISVQMPEKFIPRIWIQPFKKKVENGDKNSRNIKNLSKAKKFYDPWISPVNKTHSAKKSQRFNKSQFAQKISSFFNFEVVNNKTTQGQYVLC